MQSHERCEAPLASWSVQNEVHALLFCQDDRVCELRKRFPFLFTPFLTIFQQPISQTTWLKVTSIVTMYPLKKALIDFNHTLIALLIEMPLIEFNHIQSTSTTARIF